MKTICLSFHLFILTAAFGQSAEKTIREILFQQQDAWNKGDLDAFMKGYWQADSLMFIGKSGITYGYRQTYEQYKKNYDTREKMGVLRFELLHFIPFSTHAYMVVGKWNLTRTAGNIGGHFTLVFRKIKGRWMIVADHTS